MMRTAMLRNWRILLPTSRAWLAGECIALALAAAASAVGVLARAPGEALSAPAARFDGEFAELSPADRERLNAAFPGEPAPPNGALEILGHLTSKAAELGLSLTDHSLMPGSARAGRNVQPVALNLRGRSQALFEFVHSLCRDQLPLRLRSFHMQGGRSADEREFKLNLEIILRSSEAEFSTPPIRP